MQYESNETLLTPEKPSNSSELMRRFNSLDEANQKAILDWFGLADNDVSLLEENINQLRKSLENQRDDFLSQEKNLVLLPLLWKLEPLDTQFNEHLAFSYYMISVRQNEPNTLFLPRKYVNYFAYAPFNFKEKTIVMDQKNYNFLHANLSDTTLEVTEPDKKINFKEANLQRVVMNCAGADFGDFDFTQADLSDSTLKNFSISTARINFTNSQLDNAKLSFFYLDKTNITSEQLLSVQYLYQCHLSTDQIKKLTSSQKIQLENKVMAGHIAEEIDKLNSRPDIFGGMVNVGSVPEFEFEKNKITAQFHLVKLYGASYLKPLNDLILGNDPGRVYQEIKEKFSHSEDLQTSVQNKISDIIDAYEKDWWVPLRWIRNLLFGHAARQAHLENLKRLRDNPSQNITDVTTALIQIYDAIRLENNWFTSTLFTSIERSIQELVNEPLPSVKPQAFNKGHKSNELNPDFEDKTDAPSEISLSVLDDPKLVEKNTNEPVATIIDARVVSVPHDVEAAKKPDASMVISDENSLSEDFQENKIYEDITIAPQEAELGSKLTHDDHKPNELNSDFENKMDVPSEIDSSIIYPPILSVDPDESLLKEVKTKIAQVINEHPELGLDAKNLVITDKKTLRYQSPYSVAKVCESYQKDTGEVVDNIHKKYVGKFSALNSLMVFHQLMETVFFIPTDMGFYLKDLLLDDMLFSKENLLIPWTQDVFPNPPSYHEYFYTDLNLGDVAIALKSQVNEKSLEALIKTNQVIDQLNTVPLLKDVIIYPVKNDGIQIKFQEKSEKTCFFVSKFEFNPDFKAKKLEEKGYNLAVKKAEAIKQVLQENFHLESNEVDAILIEKTVTESVSLLTQKQKSRGWKPAYSLEWDIKLNIPATVVEKMLLCASQKETLTPLL